MKSFFEQKYESHIENLEENDIKLLTATTVSKSICRGLVFWSKKDDNNYSSELVQTPLTLFPTPYPKEQLLRAQKLQGIINQLLADIIPKKINLINEWLHKTMLVDEFTKNLMNISLKADNKRCNVELAILRTDYMLDDKRNENYGNLSLKMVEINTISASFSGFASRLVDVYKTRADIVRNSLFSKRIVDNNPIKDIALAFVEALVFKNENIKFNGVKIILFVVQSLERNEFDQRILEEEIYNQCLLKNIRYDIIRRTLSELSNEIYVDNNGVLFLRNFGQIDLVYFRAGYTPDDYLSEKEWTTRLNIEISDSIKVPTCSVQIAGCKKVQQVISNKKLLTQMLDEHNKECNCESSKINYTDIIDDLCDTFVNLYSMDDIDYSLIDKIKNSPNDYVLKPQREGGGNNLYGQKMVDEINRRLSSNVDNSLSDYIVMDMIKSTKYKNYLISGCQTTTKYIDCVSELGIFGVYIKVSDQVMANKSAGYLLRTKAANTIDGGIASGRAVLDIPLLFD